MQGPAGWWSPDQYALNKGNDPSYLTDDPDFNCQVGLLKVNISYIVFTISVSCVAVATMCVVLLLWYVVSASLIYFKVLHVQ